MKTPVIHRFLLILLAASSIAGCKKDASSGYAVDLMVTDITQTYLYYYIVFREAEDAWATIDRFNYPEDSIIADNSRGSRTITIKREVLDKSTIITTTVDFKDWKWDNTTISGRMNLNMPTETDSVSGEILLARSYRQSGTMTALLSGFSINGQQVDGFANIAYSGTAEADRYTFTLADGKIYNVAKTELLMTAALSSAPFIRTDGVETSDPTDDIWSTTGAMRGTMRNQSALTYTNSIDTKYPMLFGWNCSRKPLQGNCSLTAGSRSIAYYCGDQCDQPIELLTINHIK